jgi:hypothetical protein
LLVKMKIWYFVNIMKKSIINNQGFKKFVHMDLLTLVNS